MFLSRKSDVRDVRFLPSSGSRRPSRGAVVTSSIWHRLMNRIDAELYLKNANTLGEVLRTEVATIIASLAFGAFVLFVAPPLLGAVPQGPALAAAVTSGAAPFATALVVSLVSLLFLVLSNPVWFFAVLAALAVEVVAHNQIVGAPLFSGPSWTVFNAYVLFFGAAAFVRSSVGTLFNRFRAEFGHKGDKRDGSQTLSLSFGHAEKVTDKLADILKNCFDDAKIERIASIRTDREAPYRLIRRLLPIGPVFFRRPRFFMDEPLHRHGERYERYRLVIDMSDALCAGVLGLVGARPRLRYSEDTDRPLANDRYWRAEDEELNDAVGADVFLRFHQSTVEADFPPKKKAGDVCNYKTFAVVNNFRRTPLYLLRVRDVVDVLLCRSDAFGRAQMERIFDGLTIDGERAFELLKTAKYSKAPARADRYQYESTDTLSKAIIADLNDGVGDSAGDGQGDSKGDAGSGEEDIIMSFDPGRVWPQRDAAMEFYDAVVALRRAITLASRRLTIKVTPVRQDVLLVDNLRMLVARREDRPNGLGLELLLDFIAAYARPLSGRWMRQLYGFPARVRQSGAGDAVRARPDKMAESAETAGGLETAESVEIGRQARRAPPPETAASDLS